jgi:hypothetical protein
MVGIMDGCFALEKAVMVKLYEKLGIVNSQPVWHNAFKKLSDHDLEFSGQLLLVQGEEIKEETQERSCAALPS